MSGTFEQARTFFQQGLAHYEAGRFAEAELDYAASLALLPGRGSTLTNLGATRLKLGRLEEALHVLDQAVAREPDNVEAWGHRATAMAELGRHDDALACADRLLQLAPTLGHAWSLRGRLLKDLGRTDEAAVAFEQALANGADAELNTYFLASLRGRDAPAAPPRHYVQNLFDSYAANFEKHLIEVLHYRAHEVLVKRLVPMQRRYRCALDLGCGTGLCGELMQPLAGRVVGVDLSANMVAQARARGVYNHVEQADVTDYLTTTDSRYDLVVAGDVFIYVGALEPVFAAVARRMEPDGVFCFSLEAASETEDYALRSSLRYVHSEKYVRALAAQNGFGILAMERHPVREDQNAPIPGLFAWLVRN